jgi:peptide deformylase
MKQEAVEISEFHRKQPHQGDCMTRKDKKSAFAAYALPAMPVVASRAEWKGVVPSILYDACLPVDLDNPAVVLALPEVIAELFRAMYVGAAVGLAAPQIGVRWQLAVVDTFCLHRPRGRKIVLINPCLSGTSSMVRRKEECLSLPCESGKVSRHARIRVTNSTLGNTTEVLNLTGFLARVVQHEMDHLQGILISDR